MRAHTASISEIGSKKALEKMCQISFSRKKSLRQRSKALILQAAALFNYNEYALD